MQDGAPGAREANAWLKERFAGDPQPEITVSWSVAEPSDAVYHRLLEILFAPPSGDKAA